MRAYSTILKEDIVKNKKHISGIENYYQSSKNEQNKASKDFTAINEQLKLRVDDLKEKKKEFKKVISQWDKEFDKSPFKMKEDFLKSVENISAIGSWREKVQNFEKNLNSLKGEKESLEGQLRGKSRPQINELENNYKESINLFN